MDEEEAWDLINKVYCIGGTFEQWDTTDGAAASTALQAIKELDIGQLVVDLALESVWTALRREIVPAFWRTMCSPAQEGELDTALLTRFHDALQLLQSSVVVLAPLIQRCEEVSRECQVQYCCSTPYSSLQLEVMVQLRAALHSQMPPAAAATLNSIYAVAFRVYERLQLPRYSMKNLSKVMPYQEYSMAPSDRANFSGYDDSNVGECEGCLREVRTCECVSLMDTFKDITRMTWTVGVSQELCSAVATAQLIRAMQKRVAAVSALPHDTHRLDSLESWMKDATLGWLVLVSAPNSPDRSTLHYRHPLVRSCEELMTRTFLNHRIKNLFSIVIDYPESRPAIFDIRQCLQNQPVHQHLVDTLRASIESRLLHPGVKTVDVVHAYIRIIRALRLLDPRGALLDLVSEPIKTYLRSRRDFVRYIVTSLTDGGSLDLCGEDLLDDDLDDHEVREALDDDWQMWCPDSVYARPKPTLVRPATEKRRSGVAFNDLLSMLVDIYGSKDTFISEYRTLFADRLLSSLDCSKSSVEFETKHLEHIKKRFGSSSPYISKIEVMIRDMNVSRSVNSAVEEQRSADGQVSIACMIVSGLFWPAFKEENIELPQQALDLMKEYDEMFAKLKPNKKLGWKKHLGQVEVEIELQHKTLELKVSPGQAAVITIFQDKPRLTLQEVAIDAKTTATTARKLVAFWVEQGVLREVSPDVFEVCEDGAGGRRSSSGGAGSSSSQAVPPPPPIVEDDGESAMVPSEVQRDQELEVLWSYILGMLSNLDSLPLERIHAMLRIFVEDGTDCTQKELKVLLDQKVMQEKLLLVNGQYKLNKC